MYPDLYPNFINIRDQKSTWKILERVSSQVREKVVYILMKMILNYLCKNKSKQYNKRAITIFGKVKTFVYRLQNAVLHNQTI